MASLGSSVSSFVSTTAASIRSSTQSFVSATSALGGRAGSNASQLSGDMSRQAFRPSCVAGFACQPYFVIATAASKLLHTPSMGWVSGLRLAMLRVSGLHACCRAHSAAGEVPGAPSSSSEAQGWHFSGRASNLSLVLWYPDEAPGCSIQVNTWSALLRTIQAPA